MTSLKKLMLELVKSEPQLYMLSISKKERVGKILLDIYRNHISNTCVGAYSLRGRTEAPISMPVTWDHLATLDSARHFTIRNYKAYFKEQEDPWINWRDRESELHGSRAVVPVEWQSKLEQYDKLRNLSIVNEPSATIDLRRKNEYVLQLHDATNVYYDLRLEHEGSLMSWAIPKGLPFKKNQKRLAIRTEDHPVKYLDFEGFIPKGQHGGEQVRIVVESKIVWLKKEVSPFSFNLDNDADDICYHIHQTVMANQWLLSADKDKTLPVPVSEMTYMLVGMN